MDEYVNDYDSDRKKRILVIVGVVVAVVLLIGGVIGLVLWSRSRAEQVGGGPQPQPSGQPTGTITNTNTSGGTPVKPNNAVEPLNEPPVVEIPRAEDSSTLGGMQPADSATAAPPLPAGINRYLSDEEKKSLGYPVSWKVRYRTVQTATGVRPEYFVVEKPGDADNDGLSDADERAKGTDPSKPDTDGDTLEDGMEVTQGTDPTKADTDGDGVRDDVEIQAKTDPLDPASK